MVKWLLLSCVYFNKKEKEERKKGRREKSQADKAGFRGVSLGGVSLTLAVSDFLIDADP